MLEATSFIEKMESEGYFNVRQLPDGEYAGLHRLLYTTAICVGLNDCGYEYRFCFEDAAKAKEQLELLESVDAVPEGWVARR